MMDSLVWVRFAERKNKMDIGAVCRAWWLQPGTATSTNAGGLPQPQPVLRTSLLIAALPACCRRARQPSQWDARRWCFRVHLRGTQSCRHLAFCCSATAAPCACSAPRCLTERCQPRCCLVCCHSCPHGGLVQPCRRCSCCPAAPPRSGFWAPLRRRCCCRLLHSCELLAQPLPPPRPGWLLRRS